MRPESRDVSDTRPIGRRAMWVMQTPGIKAASSMKPQKAENHTRVHHFGLSLRDTEVQ